MLVAYARVSKADSSQSVDLLTDALFVAGISAKHNFEDLASGKKDDRPGLYTCLKALWRGVTLVIWKLYHWSRSLTHLENRIDDLQMQAEGTNRSECNHLHNNGLGQAGVWDLCCARRVRTRACRRKDTGCAGYCSCSRQAWRPVPRKAASQGASGHGGNGKAGKRLLHNR